MTNRKRHEERRTSIATKRQRLALYAGIADLPHVDTDMTFADFELAYRRRPHAATLRLMHDLMYPRTRPMRRPLPGIVLAT